MGSCDEFGRKNFVHSLVASGHQPRVSIIEFNFAEFGVIPSLYEMSCNVSGGGAHYQTAHVVPRHARCRVPVDRVLEGLVEAVKVFHDEVYIILALPQLRSTFQIVGGLKIVCNVGIDHRQALADVVETIFTQARINKTLVVGAGDIA